MKFGKKGILNIVTVIFSIVFVLANFSSVFAVTTHAFIDITPNPAGLGQTVKITYWVTPSPSSAGISAEMWQGITIEVEKPDGSTQTIEPLTTDSRGVGCINYTPDTVGTHFFEMSFPEWDEAGVIYTASVSTREALTLQEEPAEVDPDYLTTCDIPSSYDYLIVIILIIVVIVIIILGLLLRRKTQKNKE
jgi:hypothetical protein